MHSTLLQTACEHLIKADERMKPLVEKYPCPIFSCENLSKSVDPFESLTSGIISQQVSGAAAKSIKTKFINLFAQKNLTATFPSALAVSSASVTQLKSAGLSQRKAEYIKGLAEKFETKALTSQMLFESPYENILEISPWHDPQQRLPLLRSHIWPRHQ